jgi:hypothetical protein
LSLPRRAAASKGKSVNKCKQNSFLEFNKIKLPRRDIASKLQIIEPLIVFGDVLPVAYPIR